MADKWCPDLRLNWHCPRPLTTKNLAPCSGLYTNRLPEEHIGHKMNFHLIKDAVGRILCVFSCKNRGKLHQLFGEERPESAHYRWRHTVTPWIPLTLFVPIVNFEYWIWHWFLNRTRCNANRSIQFLCFFSCYSLWAVKKTLDSLDWGNRTKDLILLFIELLDKNDQTKLLINKTHNPWMFWWPVHENLLLQYLDFSPHYYLNIFFCFCLMLWQILDIVLTMVCRSYLTNREGGKWHSHYHPPTAQKST